jgi:hypothetical protein
MNLYAALSGEPLELVREHQGDLDRLPRTFLINTLVELERWPAFFEPEKKYFRMLMQELSSLREAEFGRMFGSLANFELRTGCGRVTAANLDALQARSLAYLQRQGEYAAWRREIDAIFQRLGPAVEARLYSGSLPPRLIVVVYGEGISIRREELWKRFKGVGRIIPLELGGAESSPSFLHALFTGQQAGSGNQTARTLFEVLQGSAGCSALDSWVVEAGDGIHQLCESRARTRALVAGPATGVQEPCATGMSYDRLRGYRERLTDVIHAKVVQGLRSPLELAAYVKTLEITPPEPKAGGPPAGLTLYSDRVVLGFVRDTFLAGNGTLIINNTFVEWAAVQALKRAQPRVLVARFGVRDKMKPFSSLLLFSKPRPTDQIPIMQDPLGSFIDAELLAYYIWLNAEKGLPYRGKTLYLMLAEDVDQALLIAPSHEGGSSPATTSPKPPSPATLPDLAATMAKWLGADLTDSPGKPLAL